MRQIILSICLVFSVNFANSQTTEPKIFSKVKFVYEHTPNLIFASYGIYMDTLLLKNQFPLKAFQKRELSGDSLKVVGFVEYKNFSKEDQEKIVGIIRHNAEELHGEYNIKNNVTTIRAIRSGNKYYQYLEKYFQIKTNGSNSVATFDFDAKKCKVKFSNHEYKKNFEEIEHKVTYLGVKNSGTFIYNKNQNVIGDFVLDEKLPVNVIPNLLFSNVIAGVKEYKTIYGTVTLKSVVFE